jgi:uncharacterized protein (TIGR02246 family)
MANVRNGRRGRIGWSLAIAVALAQGSMAMASDDLAKRVAQLEHRLAEAEARLAVQQVITTYGLAADTNDIPAMMSLWTDDCVIEIDGNVMARGREQSRRIIESEVHQSIQPYSAHVMGPFRIDVIDDGHAVATGYQTVYVREGQTAQGRSRVWRQSFGRWELRRTGARWEIAKRQSRAVSHPGVRELVEPSLRGRENGAN